MFSFLVALIVTGAVALAAACIAALVLTRLLEARWPPRGVLVATDGGRLHLQDFAPDTAQRDDAPAVLLLHGANLCGDDMILALAGRLAPHFRVLAPDRPGQGWSDLAGVGDLAPTRQVAILHQALRARGAGPVILVGHSLGGLIALRWALDHPADVAGLVLINATTHPRPGGLPWYQQAAQAVAGPLVAYTLLPLALATIDRIGAWLFTPESAPENYAARSRLALGMTPKRLLASLDEYAALRDHLAEHAPRYGEIGAPTTILVGDADPITPPQIHGGQLARAVPQARLVALPGAGHMAHHAHAGAVVAEIMRIASDLPSAAPRDHAENAT